MLDINFIRKNLEKVKKGAKNKGYDLDFGKLLKLDEKRRKLISEIDLLRSQRHNLSADKKEADREKGKKIKEDLQKIEPELKKVEKEFKELLSQVPNIPSPDSPIGKSEKDNVEIKKVGDIPKFDFKIKDHVELGEKLNIIDLDRAVKIGGTRSYVLKNELTILEQSILRFAIDKVREKGFEIMNVPILVGEDTLIGAGFFPFGREDVYEVNEKDKFLVGTSEASLVFYHSEEILEEKQLPKLLSGITSCFRKEAGTYGKDTKGIIRVHQFNKVEQVVLCKEEDGEKMFDFILGISEEIVKDLKLPYRLMRMCTGDMGPKNYKQVDLEVWFPGQNKYRETHSCSYLTDYQGRRSNIRYKDLDGKKHFVHTLNNTAIATPRILAAILENHQSFDKAQDKHFIKIPEVLQKYTGFKEIK